ncbi:hypothetical protein GTQ34_00015 [Muricauda sp. JGD-17]|uniref:DUF4321 domain-containing protein n=1 Tax=Flagellimonas ochracea TaxID=2696472 RepID=A0A964T8Q9_9FLAO|nr:hypothetical protein [Allomuricauda ochracea]NAY90289.1 hypothetical protein [Allomuricauda ochracea]
MVFILIGLMILSFILGILSMGDDVDNKQMELNRIVNSIVGFPVGQFKDGFPLIQSNTNFWTLDNLLLLFLNTLIQATGIVLFAKFIRKKISG